VYYAERLGLAPSSNDVFYASIVVMLVVIWKHRGNIKRLAAGTEPRLARRRDAA